MSLSYNRIIIVVIFNLVKTLSVFELTLIHYTLSSLCVCVCVSCLLFFRVQRKVFSLCVYRDGDWLHLERDRERYDSINTLVMHRLTRTFPILLNFGDHEVQVRFQYPVHSSMYYK